MNPYSPDYPTARDRFRSTATRLGWTLDSHTIPGADRHGDPLTIDVAHSPGPHPPDAPLLLVSGGLHGVEGPLGSAVQLAWLESFISSPPAQAPRIVLLHALNPYGFAHSRRFDAHNIDPNRNFLRDGQPYRGSPPGYARLDALLNPPRPPSRLSLFKLRAALEIARHGLPALKEAVAVGQYDYPHGLIYGGAGPSEIHLALRQFLPAVVAASPRIVHFDIHTGLGRHATHKLLFAHNPPLAPSQRAWLDQHFDPATLDAGHSTGVAYQPRGDFGAWCTARFPDRDYLYLCAEFGTYPILDVLTALHVENRAHHWARPGDPATIRAKARLREVFVPASPSWRSACLTQALDLLQRATRSLA